MKLTAKQVNTFNMLKLPAAYFTGVRCKSITDTTCVTSLRHAWKNQNPFKSIFWAVQGMAAELATGALVMGKIRESRESISMLVANNKAGFHKKATGKIQFTCDQGKAIDEAITQTVKTGEGQTVWLDARGYNEEGVLVSAFSFEWTVKVRRKKV